MSRKLRCVSGVFLFMLLLMFTVSCEKSTSTGTPIGGNGDSKVNSIDLTFEPSYISSFPGKTDTVLVTARALDENRVGVNNASVKILLLDDSPGAIVEIDTATNSEGDLRAYYIVTLGIGDKTADIRAVVEAAGVETNRDISIQAKQVTVTLGAQPREFSVAYSDSAVSRLTVRVKDETNVGVGGIPIRIEMISGTEEASLEPVSRTRTDGSAISNLKIDELLQTETVTVRAFVVIPTSGKAPSKGMSALRDRIGRILQGNKYADQAELDGAGGGGRYLTSVLYDTVTVTMRTFEGEIDSVFVWVEPPRLIIPLDSSGMAIVYAIAFDAAHAGIPGLQFHFSVSDTNIDPPGPTGVVSNPRLTDSTGQAQAMIRTNRQFGTWWINVAAGPHSFRTLMDVGVSPGLGGDLTLIATPSSVYADQGITTALIQATLKDNNQSAVVNDTIRFAAFGGGSIEGFAMTDDHGVATATFIDDGNEGTTQIVARYDRGNLHLYESVDVIVLENRVIDELLLFTPGTQYSVSLTDSAEVRCNVRYDSGEMAVAGTPVYFETATPTLTNASFDPPISTCDANGVARSYFYPGSEAGTDTVYCRAGEGQVGGEVHSIHIPVQMYPIAPSNIENMVVYNADGSPFRTNQRESGIVECVVVDTFYNPVADGVTVMFSADVGTVTPSGLTGTVEDPPGSGNWVKGFIRVAYTPGTQSGQARIYATSGTAIDSFDVTIESGTPQSMLLSANIQELAAHGTGGQETAQLWATVTDPNGNAVQNQTKVFFLMDQFPGGAGQDYRNPSINESDGTEPDNPYRLPYDSSLTNNGVAVVSVNSGTETGLLRIKAWAFVDEEARGTPDADSVQAVFTGLAVVAGPPSSAEIDVNEIGFEGGGAIWNLEVSARIADSRNNPVADSISVQFEVSPDIATIGDGITGNDDESGESSPGVAHTIMSYHSSVTNDSVTITVTVLSATGEPVTGEYMYFNLPIQEADGVLYADPSNWNFRNQPDPAVFHMTVFVYDGHDHCVNDQLVRFLTTRGLYYTTAALTQVMNEAYTGPLDVQGRIDGDQCGWANRYLGILFEDAFPDPRILETTATAEVEIIGYPEAAVEPATLNMQH